MRLNQDIHVRVSGEQLERLRAAATASGRTVSDLLRALGEAEAERLQRLGGRKAA